MVNESGKGNGNAGTPRRKRGRRLRWFSGALSPEETAAGMNAARRNARRLARDAKRMLETGSFATAAALAILAVEESGKVSILRGLSTASGETNRRDLWKDYRSHTSKNTGWILPELAAKGARTLEELRLATDRDGEHTEGGAGVGGSARSAPEGDGLARRNCVSAPMFFASMRLCMHYCTGPLSGRREDQGRRPASILKIGRGRVQGRPAGERKTFARVVDELAAGAGISTASTTHGSEGRAKRKNVCTHAPLGVGTLNASTAR